MYEKEAEEYYNGQYDAWLEGEEGYALEEEVEQAFKDGAEFGYNKAKEEMQEQGLALQSDMDKTIEQNIQLKKELNKANEWHYVKDGDLPKEELRPRTFGYYLTASKHKSYKGFVFEVAYFTGVIFTKGGDILDNVIAWKEIVLPKEIKEND